MKQRDLRVLRKARDQQRYPRSPSEEARLRDEVWADADKERNRDAAHLAREFGPRWSGSAP